MAKVNSATLKEAFSTGSTPTGKDFENLIDTLEISETEKQAWNNKSDFDGDYDSLTNKPSIPAKTSQLTNDSGFETASNSTTKANKSLTDAKTYTNAEIAKLVTRINDLETRIAKLETPIV